MPPGIDNGNWSFLFKYEDTKGACNFLNTHLGEIWFDMQRKTGMVPKSCPLNKV